MQLDEISIGWKTLATILDRLRKAINSNDPLKGDGISLSRTASGTIISVDPKSSDDNTPTTGQQVSEFPSYAWVTLYDVFVKDITIVDPATCAESTITVYVRSPGDAVKFQAKIELTTQAPAGEGQLTTA